MEVNCIQKNRERTRKIRGKFYRAKPWWLVPTPNDRLQHPLSYKDAGVDIDAGDALVERIKPLAKKTLREGVMAGIGGLARSSGAQTLPEPVLVSGTDGVGTKLKLAFEVEHARHRGHRPGRA